jgi:hypothetical protein
VDVNKEARSQNRVPGEKTMEISESLEQILDATDLFGESFYELFLSTYPEVQEYFEGVNMSRQAVMLTMALTIVEQHATSQLPQQRNTFFIWGKRIVSEEFRKTCTNNGATRCSRRSINSTVISGTCNLPLNGAKQSKARSKSCSKFTSGA